MMKKITYPLFLAVLSSVALPQAANAFCVPGSFSCQTIDAGSLSILGYDSYEDFVPDFDPSTGMPKMDSSTGMPVLLPAEGVSIASTFMPNQSGNYRYISAIVSADAPTIFFDGTPINKPLLDPAPGGYFGMPPGVVDLLPYYDTPPGLAQAFPGLPNLFGDQPGGSLGSIQAIGGNAEARFETWLVEVVDEVFGNDPTKAQDDLFTVNPLIGFEWGYDITNTDNNNGILDFGDFLTTPQPFSWLTAKPTDDWMTALNRVYGTGATQDNFNVEIARSVPEPSAIIGLIGLGILGLRTRKRKA